MEDKKFHKIMYCIIFIGIIITGVLLGYTIKKYEKLSITSFISTEEVIYE